MKEGRTHIEFVLDASGSMDVIKKDTIGGFNTFLRGQKETAKKGDTFTFTTFSSNYGGACPWKYIYRNADIAEVPELNPHTYLCCGGTALLDTLGDTINDLGAFLRNLQEKDRPSKVVFVILTDGEENASTRFSKHAINTMIKDQTDKWKWEFVFLGANQDAIAVGHSYGISALNSMSYAANEVGVKSTFDAVTRSLNTYKNADIGASFASSGAVFTSAERSASMGGAAVPGVTTTFTANVVGCLGSTIPLETSKTVNVKDDGHDVVV